MGSWPVIIPPSPGVLCAYGDATTRLRVDAPRSFNKLVTHTDDAEVSTVIAELTAQGNFTFDNSDLTTFAGIPAPTGKIDVKATGVNALLDTLVAMGLVPQDQADQGIAAEADGKQGQARRRQAPAAIPTG